VQRTDEELLAAGGSHEFAIVYRRYAPEVLRFFARRVRDPEAAADLTAETFAAAVVAQRRFRADRGSAASWLYGIAGHKLADFQRRGYLEDRARRQLGIARRALSEDDAVHIAALGDEVVSDMLSVLPGDQRDAVHGHVIGDRSYEELALGANISASAMRQRVSRGLRTLRDQMGGER
jgi:RNA polymerase sigma-70 factor (ECF subfamily)